MAQHLLYINRKRQLTNFQCVCGQTPTYKTNRQITSNRENTQSLVVYFFSRYPMTFQDERIIVDTEKEEKKPCVLFARFRGHLSAEREGYNGGCRKHCRGKHGRLFRLFSSERYHSPLAFFI